MARNYRYSSNERFTNSLSRDSHRQYPIVSAEVQQYVQRNVSQIYSPSFRALGPVTIGFRHQGENINSRLFGSPIIQTLPLHGHAPSLPMPGSKRRHESVGNKNSTFEDNGAVKRSRFPVEIIDPTCKYSKLSDDMQQYANYHQQSDDLLQKKLQLRSALLTLFRKEFPSASLHLVGSSCNGFATDASDADFCLMLTHSRNVDQRFEACFYLRSLQKLLRHIPSISQISLIQAKVPILKFKDSISGCDCDVNVNNGIGIRNTHLLRTYSRVDDRVRPMIMSVKRWAKFRQINDASQGTLSSYSLVLMVLHYLQSGCQPPVLVSLQQEYPDFFSSDINVDLLPMLDPTDCIPRNCSKNKQSVGELLVGFFKYFAKEFRWDFFVISVRLGRATPRALSPEWRNKFMCIEEPFERTNTARAVHLFDKFRLIKDEFSKAYETLQSTMSLAAIT